MKPNKHASIMGRKGGKVTGSCKRRGDSEHYRKMALKRWGKPSLTELLEKSVELEKQKRRKVCGSDPQ